MPPTGNFDTTTQSHLGIFDSPIITNNSYTQISPSETVGICLESENLFAEYRKNEDQFNERFNDIPLCIAGYPNTLGEKPDYFYIDFTINNVDQKETTPTLRLQCRIEKLNALHRRILKRILSIDTDKKIQVKGIYQPSTALHNKTLILDQCYLIQIADRNE